MSGDPGGAVRLVLSTLPDRESARRLARALVDERLAACGNILVGVESIYRWQGDVEESDEVLVILKTTESKLPELLERGPDLHPYDVPEFVAVPVPSGHPEYLAWVDAGTGGGA